eukprot:3246637-Pyramimonas_sp.AAC.1
MDLARANEELVQQEGQLSTPANILHCKLRSSTSRSIAECERALTFQRIAGSIEARCAQVAEAQDMIAGRPPEPSRLIVVEAQAGVIRDAVADWLN